MAANKFATIVHRNSNKITLILVYALLEWLLILLLLLQGLFSYFIIKFAEFFGLNRPCLWCSRVDHVFQPGKPYSYRDLLCEAHAMEISNLGYCSNHRKLTEVRDLCEGCSSHEFYQIPEEEDLRFCSCCGDSLKNRLFSPCVLIKPNWGDLDYAQKGNLVSEAEIDVIGKREISIVSDGVEAEKNSTCSVSGCGCKDSAVLELEDDKSEMGVEKIGGFIELAEDLSSCNKKTVEDCCEREDELGETAPPNHHHHHLEFYIDQGDDRRLIPVDLIDFSTSEDAKKENMVTQVRDEEEEQEDCGNEDVVLDFGSYFEKQGQGVREDWEFVSGERLAEFLSVSMHESKLKVEDPSMEVEHKEEQEKEEAEVEVEVEAEAFIDEATIEAPKEDVEELVVATRELDSDLHQEFSMWNDELEVEISIGTDIRDHEPIDEIRAQNDIPLHSHVQEDPSPSSSLEVDNMQDSNEAEEVEEAKEVEEVEEAKEVEEVEETKEVEEVEEAMEVEELGEVEEAKELEEAKEVVEVKELEEVEEVEEAKELEVAKEVVEVEEHEEAKEVVEVEEAKEVVEVEKLEEAKEVVEVEVAVEVEEVEVAKEVEEAKVGKKVEEAKEDEVVEEAKEVEEVEEAKEVEEAEEVEEADEAEEVEEAKEKVEFKILSVETCFQLSDDHKPLSSDLNENEEEDKLPDTPTSMDSLHQLHKKLLLLDRKEFGTEESLDGSVISETEGGDVVLTVEKLKSALKTERKALNALYSELEEERSASAIAANQTMAMINRLQEEKASMQMEALQYQRMMEEQSEYDQEALQLLNELVVKREREKQELEKEIEVYRKKLQDHEAKEKIALLRNRKEGSIQSRNSSVSCSNPDDSDGLSIDLNTETKKDEDLFSNQETNNQNTPVEAVLYLEETLTNFEEERLSILEELKMLEEKLFTLSDEEQELEDIEHYYEQNGNGYHKNSNHTTETNGFENGHHVKEMNGKHYTERRTMSTKAKRLLPLFDDVVDADVDDVTNGEEQGFDSVSIHKSSDNKFDTEFKRIAVEEEVDHVYERLQALEADREFLKHCIGSLRKGDKGLELLQEILQHLRDLRSVDLQLKNMGDSVLA